MLNSAAEPTQIPTLRTRIHSLVKVYDVRGNVVPSRDEEEASGGVLVPQSGSNTCVLPKLVLRKLFFFLFVSVQ